MPEFKDLFFPHLPEVDIRTDIDSVFSKARLAADQSREDEDGIFHRQVIIVTPGRLLISKLCPLPSEIPADRIIKIILTYPSPTPKNIAVISYTYLEALKKIFFRQFLFLDFCLVSLQSAILFGFLRVIRSAMKAGCKDADILLVDGGILPYLGDEIGMANYCDEFNAWKRDKNYPALIVRVFLVLFFVLSIILTFDQA